MVLDKFDHVTTSVHVFASPHSTVVSVTKDSNFDVMVCAGGTDDQFIAVNVTEEADAGHPRHGFTMYLPWALCDLIAGAYSHELEGADHDAEITPIKEESNV